MATGPRAGGGTARQVLVKVADEDRVPDLTIGTTTDRGLEAEKGEGQ